MINQIHDHKETINHDKSLNLIVIQPLITI